MRDLKIETGKAAAYKYSIDSFIGAIGEKVRLYALVTVPRIPVSMRRLSQWQCFMLFTCGIPAVAVTGALLGTYLLGPTIKYTPDLFFCAVVLSNWGGGVSAGVFSVLLSAVALDYYFIPPIYALGISPEDMPDMALFVTLGLLVSCPNRCRIQANASGRERPHERNSDIRSDDSIDERLDRAHSDDNCSDCRENNKEMSGLTASGGEVDEKLRAELHDKPGDADTKELVTVEEKRVFFRGFGIPLLQDSVFCKRGDYWAVQYRGEIAWLKATRGLESLAYLLGNPGREFHVRELIFPVGSAMSMTERSFQQVEHQMRTVCLQDAGPILDDRAKAEYKLRLAELREELEDAERSNDMDRAEKIQEESDAISTQLAAAVGLGGRERKAASQAERARSAVTKRIRSSIQRIARTAPCLGRHLARSIRTGYFCSYNPDPDCTVKWKLNSEPHEKLFKP